MYTCDYPGCTHQIANPQDAYYVRPVGKDVVWMFCSVVHFSFALMEYDRAAATSTPDHADDRPTWAVPSAVPAAFERAPWWSPKMKRGLWG